MIKRRNKYPEVGEIIIGTVKTVNPNSVIVNLDEYGKQGLVHVSEISRKWVRDIRQFAKKGEIIVAVVSNVDKEKEHINLSVKRLSEGDKNKRLQTWKRDQKGEKLLEKYAEENKIDLKKAYEEIGYDIQDSFRDMLEGFETTLNDPSILERKGFDKDLVAKIKEIADKNIEIKDKELKGFLDIKCYSPDAIITIKKSLSAAKKKFGVSIGYISAPKYQISFTTKDLKKGDKILNEAAEFVCGEIKKNKGECDFSRNKEM